MGHPKYNKDEIAERGLAIYERRLRPLVEPAHIGEFMMIDIETGDYEIDHDRIAVSDRAHARHPNGAFYVVRVGYPASGTIGASFAGIN